jgi:hypothetical protein
MNGRLLRALTLSLVASVTIGCGQSSLNAGRASAETALTDSAFRRRDSLEARQFVQEFFSWYVPIANAETRVPAWWRVLSQRPNALDSALLAALRADSAVQRTDGKEMREFLNFDPLLSSQDPCPRYEAVDARRDSIGYRVTVKPICADTTWQTQRPVLSVVRRAGQWKIVNVFYETSDLRTILCEFARRDLRPDHRRC